MRPVQTICSPAAIQVVGSCCLGLCEAAQALDEALCPASLFVFWTDTAPMLILPNASIGLLMDTCKVASKFGQTEFECFPGTLSTAALRQL